MCKSQNTKSVCLVCISSIASIYIFIEKTLLLCDTTQQKKQQKVADLIII